MKEWINISTDWFNNYCNSFRELSDKHQFNFEIKREHSLRVAEISLEMSKKLEWSKEEGKTAFLVGLLHDIGRFRQLIQFDTFNDEKSVDHAQLAVNILKEENPFEVLKVENKELLFAAILNHNKFKIQEDLSGQELLHAKLIRDADKLDIFRVLTEYYSKRNGSANHTLTWELQKGTVVSSAAAKEVLAGKIVSKKNVLTEMDLKIMQLSWVYDLNFRPTVEYLIKNRYLENIYNSLPKNDMVIEIYRKIKVFTENRIMANTVRV
jgi:putative nucleotidyltransferase with HDIG domain